MSNTRYTRSTSSIDRRSFLTRSGLMAGGLALGPAFLAACGKSDGSGSSATGGGGDKELYFANWPEYIDEETVKLFIAASGVDMKYTTEYNDNNEYFAKIQPNLSQGKAIGPDIIAPTSWMAGRLISLGWVEKLPLDAIPNAKNLDPSLQKPAWDPTGEYSMPWQSGFAGIAYNRKVTGRDLTSMDDLWDAKFKGKIGLLTEMRDTVGLAALSMGVDISKPTFKALEPVFAALKKQVDSGQVRSFTGNDYIDDLSSGNFAACVGWSGDIVQLSRDNPDVAFVIPESGGTLWSDAMVVPKGAKNVAAAAKWMNYVYDPVNAARIAAFVQYVSPVVGVQAELKKMGGDAAEAASSTLIFPTDEMKKNLHSFGLLSEEDEAKADEAFSKLAGN